MTLTVTNGGFATSSSATNIDVSYPGSIAAGDLLVLIAGMKPSTENTGSISNPSGWTAQLAGFGGGYGTTLGADTGNTYQRVATKEAAGTESGTLSVSMSGADVSWAIILRIASSTGGSARLVGAARGMSDTTAGDYSATNTISAATAVDDLLISSFVIPTDVTTPSQFSAHAYSQTGSTFSGITEVGEADSSLGNDIGGLVFYGTVATGGNSNNVTQSATAGGTTTNVRGPGGLLILREERRGTLSKTLGALTLTSASKLAIAAALSKTLGTLTVSSTAQLLLKGTLSQTLGALTLSADSDLLLKGTVNSTLGSLTLSSEATLSAAGGAVLTATLGSLTVDSSGQLLLKAAASPTLGALTLAGTAQLLLKAQAAPTLDALSLAATGTLDIAGSSGVTLGSLGLTSTAQLLLKAAVTSTLGSLQLAATGVHTTFGSATLTLSPLAVTGIITLVVQADIAQAARISLAGGSNRISLPAGSNRIALPGGSNRIALEN